jgi:hypothetical protein
MKSWRLPLLLFVLLASVGAWLCVSYLERSQRNAADNAPAYSLIEEGLYVGPYVREPPPGTEVVLNLCETQDRYDADVHSWEPISDGGEAPSLEWLRHMVQFIDAQHRAGKTVYVHCSAGVSRSGLVAAAYLMHEHDWTRDEALEFLRSKRPQIRPNPAFMELLLEWEELLQDLAAVGER